MKAITSEHFTERLERGAGQAKAAGFDGLLIAPGADLAYFADYLPIATTERITLLVVPADGDPTMIVPRLEHDGAVETRAAERHPLRRLVRRHRRVRADSGPAGPVRPVRGLRRTLVDAPARPAAEASGCALRVDLARPADAARRQGRRRDRPARRSGCGGRRHLRGHPRRALRRPDRERRGRPTWRVCSASTATRRSTSRSSAAARTAPTRTTRRASAPSKRATWSCSTSAGSWTATARTPLGPCTSASRPTRSTKCSRSSSAPSRPRSRLSPSASPARRSTGPRGPSSTTPATATSSSTGSATASA